MIDGIWQNLKDFILNSMVRKEVKTVKGKKIRYKDWWDRSCTRKTR